MIMPTQTSEVSTEPPLRSDLEKRERPITNMEEFNVKGTVRLTKEGEVRWTTFSIFHGVERWRSEGVQIGGVRSARGVVGNWFDRYDIIYLSWDDSLTLAQRLRYPRPCGPYSVLEGCDA